MRDEDPLDSWFYLDRARKSDKLPAKFYKQTRTALRRLSAMLDAPISRKVDLTESGIYGWGRQNLAPADLSRACDLYRRVVNRGGRGTTFVQEGLLEMISSTKDPVSIPFWLEILDLSRPHDTFLQRRRIYALGALARIAIRHNAADRFEPLRAAARHQDPEVRELAVYSLRRALEGESSIPSELQPELREIALCDPAFGPRFHARWALQAAGEPVPLDNASGIFLFKLYLEDKRSYRIIAVRSKQTLETLHFAIQSAIEWDADHLYAFFLNGRMYDRRCAFYCPEGNELPFANEAAIGNLGLTLNHKFLYLFDYGDNNEFWVGVVGIRPEAGRGKYPRVVESQGGAPEQYPRWE